MPLYREWYYPALSPNMTHVEVDADNLRAEATALLADSGAARRAALAASAATVHQQLMCPCCLAEFYSQLMAAVAAKQASHWTSAPRVPDSTSVRWPAATSASFASCT